MNHFHFQGWIRSAAAALLILLAFHACAVQAFAQQPQTRIMVMDAEGGNPRGLVRIENYTRHGVPRWSPDGREIVFEVSWKETGEYEPRVFKVSAGGGQPTDLGLGKMPSWSPDGKQIVFRIPPDVGVERTGVWIMNTDGTSREYLFPGHQPFFSPDAGRIVYTNEEQNNMFVYDVLDGSHRKLSQPYSRIIGYAAWSANGKQLCFIGRKDTGEVELAITAADGKQEVPQVCWSNKALVRFPIWGPSEKILLTMRHQRE